jgi:hypothetical protein
MVTGVFVIIVYIAELLFRRRVERINKNDMSSLRNVIKDE